MARLDEASELLANEALSLDIPEEMAELAELEYNRLASWLAGEGSDLRLHDLRMDPQGSFRLGTPVRPISHVDEFDIDLVCQLDIRKEDISQKELKALVGDRLLASDEYKSMLKERRRCWSLMFPHRFHLDVLPTIPDADHNDRGVLLTDLQLARWQFSNPRGYADWFFNRMRPLVREQQEVLAKSASVHITDIPEWRVRTPLQRAVQVLKRHRDVEFAIDLDNRPVSIILTTLAARAYKGQTDLATALIQLAGDMPRFIENREGKWWVENPAHKGENFADKWNEKAVLREAFLRWLDQLARDVNSIADAPSVRDRSVLLEKSLGTRGDAQLQKASAMVPVPDDISHLQRPVWPSREMHGCQVEVNVFPGVRRGKRLGSLRRVVHKRAGLQFKATTNTPAPYEIFWQVTNTGPEARKKNQLRGGFDKGEGPSGSIRWEETAYRGTHFVEAFVIKNNECVARSGRVDVRIAK